MVLNLLGEGGGEEYAAGSGTTLGSGESIVNPSQSFGVQSRDWRETKRYEA